MMIINQKVEKFKSRFLQQSLVQFLSINGVYEQLLEALTEKDIDRLVEENVFFSQTCSPSSIIHLSNVPECKLMKLVTIEMKYLKLFLKEEITGILLHEIGHAFNPDKQKLEAEFIADNFAKEKGFSKWIISGLKNGLKQKLIGFEEKSIIQRIDNIK